MLREVFVKEVDDNLLILANVLINNSDNNFWVYRKKENDIEFINSSDNNYKFNRYLVVILSEKPLENVATIRKEGLPIYKKKVGEKIFIEEGPYHFSGANKLIEFVKKNLKRLK